ncbi:DUF5133 domain-containing protein [Streptomyces sp. NPDC002580]|uniref:DUF5133 domain-containing protein n=1 Tax=Streptomyces sp. NPDC002580 TaxID=3364653 RepID=UPI0036AF52CC
MLVPDPKVVRRLLTRYAALKIAYAERETAETARELEDVTYTLCVMTGTIGVREAVMAADAMLVTAGNLRDAQRGGLLGNSASPAAAPNAMPVAASALTPPPTEVRTLDRRTVGLAGPLF